MDKKNVIGVFSDVASVNASLNTLEINGYTKEDISVVSTADAVVTDDVKFENNVVEGIKDSAKTGGIIGGILGLLIGIGALTIPGIGLLFITGPIATAFGITGLAGATASGALTGSLVGGIAGALKEIGVDERLAIQYEEKLKEGNIIVGVKTSPNDVSKVKEIFKNNGATNISDLSLAVRDNS